MVYPRNRKVTKTLSHLSSGFALRMLCMLSVPVYCLHVSLGSLNSIPQCEGKSTEWGEREQIYWHEDHCNHRALYHQGRQQTASFHVQTHSFCRASTPCSLVWTYQREQSCC